MALSMNLFFVLVSLLVIALNANELDYPSDVSRTACYDKCYRREKVARRNCPKHLDLKSCIFIAKKERCYYNGKEKVCTNKLDGYQCDCPKPSATPSTTSTATATPTPTSSPSASTTTTATATPTPSSTPSVSTTSTATATPTPSSTPSVSTTSTATATPTSSTTSTATATPTPSNSPAKKCEPLYFSGSGVYRKVYRIPIAPYTNFIPFQYYIAKGVVVQFKYKGKKLYKSSVGKKGASEKSGKVYFKPKRAKYVLLIVKGKFKKSSWDVKILCPY